MSIPLTALTPVSLPDETVVDLRAPGPVIARLEVGLAPHSEHNLYAGFDGVQGVFVATWAAVGAGTEVDLTLRLPGGATVETQGVVDFLRAECRDGAPGVGIRFLGLDEVDARTLSTFAELREPIFYC